MDANVGDWRINLPKSDRVANVTRFMQILCPNASVEQVQTDQRVSNILKFAGEAEQWFFDNAKSLVQYTQSCAHRLQTLAERYSNKRRQKLAIEEIADKSTSLPASATEQLVDQYACTICPTTF